MLVFRVMANIVVLTHFAYVMFVVMGQIAILAGLAMRAGWARNFWFRTIHLAMIAIVVVESIFGVACPLTTLENHFRRAAGQDPDAIGFIERMIHSIMFFNAPGWVFALLYAGFGAIVLGTFVLAPPRRPGRSARIGDPA